jgi:hypothetical protein
MWVMRAFITRQFASLADRLADPEWIKAEQRRIVSLLHADHCPRGSAAVGGNGEVCTEIPRCKEMKALKQHVDACNDRGCGYSCCKSSKYLLNHFLSCYDSSCVRCEKVRQKCSWARPILEERARSALEEGSVGVSSEQKRKHPWEESVVDVSNLTLLATGGTLPSEVVHDGKCR